MALSQATLIQRVRRVIGDAPYETYDVAGVANVTTDTNVDIPDSSKLAVGAVIEWQDNGEQGLVKSIVDSNTVTVKRQHNGTTAQVHAANVVLLVNPTFTYVDIKNALDRCIQGLWPYAWKAVTDTITPSTTAAWYDLAADAIDLISVTQLYGASSQYLATFGSSHSGLSIQMERNLPVGLAASGVGVRFQNGFSHATNAVTLTYRAKITATVSSGDYQDINDGLLAEAITYGAAYKLVAYKEIPLTTAQDVSMGETPLGPGPRLNVSSWLYGQYKMLLNNYYDELMLTQPPMRVWSGR